MLWLKDIERSLAVDEPDLDELVRRCRRYRCAAPVGLMLNRSRILLGAEVPDEIIGALLPSSLRSVDGLLGRLRPRVRLDERETAARWLSRSARESLPATFAAVPERARRSTLRRLRPPPANETDDPEEKSGFLRSVVAASGGTL